LLFHCEGPVPIGDSLSQYSFSVSISGSGTILDFIGVRSKKNKKSDTKYLQTLISTLTVDTWFCFVRMKKN